MLKLNFFRAFSLFLLSILYSCDTTTADPINHHLNNPSNPGGNGGVNTPTITGPRIFHKLIINNVTNQEFVTTGTVLEKGMFKEASGPTAFLVGKTTYSSGKISKVKFEMEENGSVQPNTLSYEFNITYDSAGRMNYTTNTMMMGAVASFNREYTYTYDSAGKMTKIIEKQKMGATYTHFTNYNITNTGDNLTKLVTESGMTSPSGVADMSTVISQTYNFPTYDTKINPYTTLPKEFFVMWSLLHPINFSMLSSNNVKTFNIVFPSVPAINGAYNYLYDSENYPVSDQSQYQKYVYKAL